MLGEYFRKGGYQTHYRGKWHLSDEDLLVPGTQTALMSNDVNGNAYPERLALYEEARRLEKYGFSGWIGPEPHGSAQANDGTVRDPGFADQVCRLLKELDGRADSGADAPWLIVSSFVNPHDIVFSGIPWFTKFSQLQQAGKLPDVAPSPTASESLEDKRWRTPGQSPGQTDVCLAKSSTILLIRLCIGWEAPPVSLSGVRL